MAPRKSPQPQPHHPSSTTTPLTSPPQQQQQTATSSSSSSSSSTTTTMSSSIPPPSALTAKSSPRDILQHIWARYLHGTPPRMLLLDTFMAFLVVVGAVQFVYCVLVGNYPFNAFLSGFSATVGQFVLTASLRMQMHDSTSTSASTSALTSTGDNNNNNKSGNGKRKEKEKEILDGKDQGSHVSSERAFADYVFGSLVLHFFCVNFIN